MTLKEAKQDFEVSESCSYVGRWWGPLTHNLPMIWVKNHTPFPLSRLYILAPLGVIVLSSPSCCEDFLRSVCSEGRLNNLLDLPEASRPIITMKGRKKKTSHTAILSCIYVKDNKITKRWLAM